MKMEKLIIIGSGPAGLTAAIYAARGNLHPLVISGPQPGGQLTITSDVEDFPGFPQGVAGPELMKKMREQAERLGVRFLTSSVTAVNFKKKPFEIKTPTETIFAQSVIVATGASAKWLDLPSEQRLIGRGVSACAVCDGPFFKGKDVVVVGGGDTALREAQYLSKLAKSVTIVHRRDEFKAQAALQDAIKAKDNIKILLGFVVDEILGEEKVTGVRLKQFRGSKTQEIPTDGIFIAIGHEPNAGFLKGELELDQGGYIKVYRETFTSVPGVFVAGDVADHKYRQAVTAAGAGAKAALDVEEYLENLPPS